MKKLLLATSLLGFITTNSFAMEGEGDIFRSSLVGVADLFNPCR